jgi:hypothetical protein
MDHGTSQFGVLNSFAEMVWTIMIPGTLPTWNGQYALTLMF